MKKIVLILVWVSINPTYAINFWPGGDGVCNETLQNCVNNSPEGEIIEIRTNNTINESIFTNNVVSLIAASGYKPTFAAGNFVTINSNTATPYSVRVAGLTFNRGYIQFTHSGTNASIIIENNTFHDDFFDLPNIAVVTSSNANLNVDIKFNRANTFVSDGASHLGSISLRKSGAEVGTVSGQIYGNQVSTIGNDAVGVLILQSTEGMIDMNIAGNEIFGGATAGLMIHQLIGNGQIDIDVVSNAFYRHNHSQQPSGVRIINDSGVSNVDVINNTILESSVGISATENSGDLIVNVFNNVVAYASIGYEFVSGVEVNNDHNVNFDNDLNVNYIPGPNVFTQDPNIISLQNARLKPNSELRDSGDIVDYALAGDTPAVDADGTYRFKSVGGANSAIDVGAYEYGDFSFIHQQADDNTNQTPIDNPLTNFQSGLDDLFITAVFNPGEMGGVFNNANEGIYYIFNNWRIFNQENDTDMALGAAFNVAKFGAALNTFEHTQTENGLNSTELNQAGLNGFNDRILQITQHWTGVNNPHPVGVLYFAGKWRIVNNDLQDMPVGSNFNVYFQPPSKSAWVHRSTAGNSSGGVTELDHPLLNGVNCAQIQVTQSANQGAFNNSPIGLSYFAGRWRIYNQNGNAMPENAAFHVVINPAQIAECFDVIFESGFE